MKKIMFNDKYGLTKAVLEGRKTMTRRIIPEKYNAMIEAASKGVLVVPLSCIPAGVNIEEFAEMWSKQSGRIRVVPVQDEPRILYHSDGDIIKVLSRYKVGESIAVAQSYESIHDEMMAGDYGDGIYDAFRWAYVADSPGWSNKMFVRADLMPHQIRITNVRVERLQDISEEDCIREGVFAESIFDENDYYTVLGIESSFKFACEAFAALIDKVSGRGTFDSNPWVFVYEFELVK